MATRRQRLGGRRDSGLSRKCQLSSFSSKTVIDLKDDALIQLYYTKTLSLSYSSKVPDWSGLTKAKELYLGEHAVCGMFKAVSVLPAHCRSLKKDTSQR